MAVNSKTPLICELKARRQALGLSLQELGAQSGVEEDFLADWEAGLGSPQLDAAERWAAALGVKLAVLPGESRAMTGLQLDWTRRRVTVDGAPVRLTPMEWKALERLARTPGEIVTHHDLFRHLYGDDRLYRAESTAIRVLITKLRRLLPIRIEARWGKGYIVSGIEPCAPGGAAECGGDKDVEPPPVNRAAERAMRDVKAFIAKSSPREPAPTRREVVNLADATVRRLAVPPPRPTQCRAEELGVIERFLAERGVTRCPDVATIQQSPLPTLIWDKTKRKWVRPAMTG